MPDPVDELSYSELNFWEKAFLARASANGDLHATAAAQECSDFADCAIQALRKAEKRDQKNTARKSARRVPGA